MKTDKATTPTVEQLTTLTARLAAAGIIPKLRDREQMFRAALEYWQACDGFLNGWRELGAKFAEGRAKREADRTAALADVPRPGSFPASFQWALNNLFDGERERLRDYVSFWSAKDESPHRPAPDPESFIAPIAAGGLSEAYFETFLRHWQEWRTLRTREARAKAGQLRHAKKKPLTRGKQRGTARLLK
jgi:hypothetical protein